MPKPGKKKKISVKEMKFRNDPMIRLYDRTQEWLQDKGRPLVIAIGVVVGAVVLYTAGYYYLQYRDSRADRAFAQAYEKYAAPVVQSTTTTQVGKFYTDEKLKWQETADAFEQLAADYPGYYRAIGKYYSGLSYLHLDRDRGMAILREVAALQDQPTSDLARLALAERLSADGEYDAAIAEYEGIQGSSTISRQAVLVGLGRAHERAGNIERAADIYFEVASADRTTPAGLEAENRLSALAPDRVKDLPSVALPPQ